MDWRGIAFGAGVGAAAGLLYGAVRKGVGVTRGKLPPSVLAPTGAIQQGIGPKGLPAAVVPATDTSSGDAFFASLVPGGDGASIRIRSRQIYAAVKRGFFDMPRFAGVTLTFGRHTATLPVLADALTMWGRRINIDQYHGQLITDQFGCIAMTRKVADAIFQQATFKPTPSTYAELNNVQVPGVATLRPNLVDMGTTAAMLRHSSVVDRKLAQLGRPAGEGFMPIMPQTLVANVGKDWLLNSWFWLPGKNTQHCGHAGMGGNVDNIASSVNYGWFQQSGVPIQGAANCHEITHSDYSQVLRFVGGKIRVDGVEMNTADCLLDPEYAGLLVDEPSLPGWRHPGVPLDAAVA